MCVTVPVSKYFQILVLLIGDGNLQFSPPKDPPRVSSEGSRPRTEYSTPSRSVHTSEPF